VNAMNKSNALRDHRSHLSEASQAVILGARSAQRGTSPACGPQFLIQGIFNQAKPSVPSTGRSLVIEGGYYALVDDVPGFPFLTGIGCKQNKSINVGIGSSVLHYLYNSTGTDKDNFQTYIGANSVGYCCAHVNVVEEPAQQLAPLMSRLSNLVDSIRNSHTLLPASPEVDALLEKAISRQDQTTDIKAWAERIANDVSGLTD